MASSPRDRKSSPCDLHASGNHTITEYDTMSTGAQLSSARQSAVVHNSSRPDGSESLHFTASDASAGATGEFASVLAQRHVFFSSQAASQADSDKPGLGALHRKRNAASECDLGRILKKPKSASNPKSQAFCKRLFWTLVDLFCQRIPAEVCKHDRLTVSGLGGVGSLTDNALTVAWRSSCPSLEAMRSLVIQGVTVMDSDLKQLETLLMSLGYPFIRDVWVKGRQPTTTHYTRPMNYCAIGNVPGYAEDVVEIEDVTPDPAIIQDEGIAESTDHEAELGNGENPVQTRFGDEFMGPAGGTADVVDLTGDVVVDLTREDDLTGEVVIDLTRDDKQVAGTNVGYVVVDLTGDHEVIDLTGL